MDNSWTGGQYSVFRILFGLYLFVHFAHLAPWSAELFSSAGMTPDAWLSPLLRAFPNILAAIDAPAFVVALCLAAAAAALCFAVGWHDRWAALIVWYVLACLVGRNPLITNPSLPYVGWMLLAHACLPAAPYGSAAARGRSDPAGDWRFPRRLFAAAWIVLALSYSYSGYTKLLSPSWVSGEAVAVVLDNPLARDWILRDIMLALPPLSLQLLTWAILIVELLFAPLCLIRKLRPWMWLAMLIVQLGIAALLRFPDLTIAMLLVHLFTFDPRWLKARDLSGVTVFYDGGSALCHAVVRFLIAEDRALQLRFAALVPARQKGTPPETIVVRAADGRLHIEADAVVHLLDGLGGLWRVIAWGLSAVPAPARRRAYRAIGSRRYALFGRPPAPRPILAPRVRGRIAG
jgi:predicted DCC family thiol-disulfide oxidoreductase YuxK